MQIIDHLKYAVANYVSDRSTEQGIISFLKNRLEIRIKSDTIRPTATKTLQL